MTDHPLTEDRAAEMWDASPCPEGYEFRGMLTGEQYATVYAMRAAFDAGREHERDNPEDDRPWESLKKGDPVHVGDTVRRDRRGITRIAVVGRVGLRGPWTAEGDFIGNLDDGTWYVRRAVQELPTKPGTVIIPAEGHEYIEATVDGRVRRASEAVLGPDARWHGIWHGDWGSTPSGYVARELITTGTWKVDGK